MDKGLSILSGILFCSVFVWFYLCNRLFTALRTRHPERYAAMGSPRLIKNNTPSNNFAFLAFLLRRRWRDLNDRSLENLCKVMLGFFALYTLGLIIYTVAMAYTPSQ